MMHAPMEAAHHFVERQVPHIEPHSVCITPLKGGLTESTFLVEAVDRKYVLKFLDSEAPLSNIFRELWVSALASELGIGPKLLEVDIVKRAILMEFIDEKKTDIPGALKKLKALHEAVSPAPFGAISKRIRAAKKKNVIFSEEMEEALCEVEKLEELLTKSGVPFTLCHNDFHMKNIVGVKVVDWGSSGLGHPYYDVAKLTFAMEYPEALALLEVYLGHRASEKEEAQFFCFRALVNMSVATNQLLKDDEKEQKTAEEAAKRFLSLIRSPKGVEACTF